MSNDLRERLARAIYDHSWMYDRTKPWTLAPENEKRLCYVMADAALAEMDDNRDGYLGLYAGPIAVGMSFIWEPNKPHARQVFTVTCIEEREHDERRIYSAEGVWNDESRFREAVVAIEPAPVSARDAARVLLDYLGYLGESPVWEAAQKAQDSAMSESADVVLAALRAIAEGRE